MKHGIEYLTGNTKRSLDIMGSLVLGTALLPVGAAVGVGTMIDTKAVNPFFVQDRVGRGGVHFAALKFRTIPINAMSGEHHGTFDPRASQWGQLLRQTGIDEAPQLKNVFLGSMSLVGARPMLAEDVEFMNFSAPHLFDE